MLLYIAYLSALISFTRAGENTKKKKKQREEKKTTTTTSRTESKKKDNRFQRVRLSVEQMLVNHVSCMKVSRAFFFDAMFFRFSFSLALTRGLGRINRASNAAIEVAIVDLREMERVST